MNKNEKLYVKIMVQLEDLHKQATRERSHYYVGKCLTDAMIVISEFYNQIKELKNKK